MPATNLNSQSSKLIVFPGCDPKQKLCTQFEANEINDKPELVILNWLVDLPYSIDPAFAAQSVLIKLNAGQHNLSDDQKSLMNLLRVISNHPREMLLDTGSANKRSQRRKNWLKRTGQRTFI